MGAWTEKKTAETEEIEKLLREKFPNYPPAYPPAAYRYNPASIRVRLVHEGFRGKSKSEREKMVLPVIRSLPDDLQMDVTLLILLAPDEMGHSLSNFEFEQPSPSLL